MGVSKLCGAAVILLGVFSAPVARAQTIHVDATPTHATNTIKPTEALGAGIDRLPFGAADKLFVDETIKQVLSAGWQTVTYRQNTELHVEAWHWNPQGTWSDPAGKGYFTGSATPGTEMLRHSYGYPLPHRGVTRDDGTDTEGYSRLTDGDEASYWKMPSSRCVPTGRSRARWTIAASPYLPCHSSRRRRETPARNPARAS